VAISEIHYSQASKLKSKTLVFFCETSFCPSHLITDLFCLTEGGFCQISTLNFVFIVMSVAKDISFTTTLQPIIFHLLVGSVN